MVLSNQSHRPTSIPLAPPSTPSLWILSPSNNTKMIYSAFDLVVSKGQRTEPCQNPNLSVAEHWNQTYLIWAATAFVADSLQQRMAIYCVYKCFICYSLSISLYPSFLMGFDPTLSGGVSFDPPHWRLIRGVSFDPSATLLAVLKHSNIAI